VYNDSILDLASRGGQTLVLCSPAIAASVHSLYWAGDEPVQEELSAVLGVECSRENQCVNTDRMLSDVKSRVKDLDLWFRMHVGSGIALNESTLGILPEYFDSQLELADLTQESWTRDLQESMAQATGGRLSANLDDYAAHGSRSVLLSGSAYDVRWMEQFDPDRDKVESFTAANGEKYAVNTMRSFSDHEIFRAQAGTLAVVDVEGGLELWAILPREGDSVTQLLQTCDMQEFTRWRSLAEMSEMGVALPELDLDLTHDLTASLREMGLLSLSDGEGFFDKVGRGFSGVDTVLTSSHLRFLHEAAPEAPVPSPTPQSQLITRPREPDMLVFDRECLLLIVDPARQAIVYAVALRTV